MSQVHSAHTHRHLRKWSSEGTANSLRDPQTREASAERVIAEKQFEPAVSLCLPARQYAYAMVNWYRSVSNGGTRVSRARASFPSHVAILQFSSSGCWSLWSFLQSLSCPTMLTCNRVTLYTDTCLVLVFSPPALLSCVLQTLCL